MSQAELRTCLQAEQALNVRSDEIDQQELGIQKQQTQLEELEARIERQKPLVDRYSQESVDSFNRLISRHRRLAKEYNQSVEPFNNKIAAYKADQDRFNATCAGKSYYESDMQAVRASMR